MESFIHEWPVHHEPGVIEACSELSCDDVEIVLVPNWYWSLVQGEETLVRPPAGRIGRWEVKLVIVRPLQWAR